MGLLKFAIIGAAAAYGINYITKKREDGTSIMDEIVEKAPEWIEKATYEAEHTLNQVAENVRKFAAQYAES